MRCPSSSSRYYCAWPLHWARMRWFGRKQWPGGQPPLVHSATVAVHAFHRHRPGEHLPGLVASVRAQSADVTGRRNIAGPRAWAGGGRQLGGQPGLVCWHGIGLRRDHAADAEAAHVPPGPQRQGSLLTQSWVQAGRLLTEWRRDRAVLVGSLLFPVCLLLVYEAVLDERV